MTTSIKTCFKCLSAKPLSDFYKHKGMADGHLNKCKECTKRDVFKHRKENVQSIRQYDRERAKLSRRAEASARYTREWRAANPEKYKAHNAVNNAVRDGRLMKLACEYCGNPETEAHHPDYSAPLSVVWLCAEHHKEIHLAYPDDYYDTDERPALPEWTSSPHQGKEL